MKLLPIFILPFLRLYGIKERRKSQVNEKLSRDSNLQTLLSLETRGCLEGSFYFEGGCLIQSLIRVQFRLNVSLPARLIKIIVMENGGLASVF